MTQDLVDRKVHIDGDTAILTETDNYTYAESGHTSTGSLRLTTTYLDRGDLWVAIAEQMNAPRSKPDLSAAEATLRKLDAEWAQTKSVDAWLGFYADDAIVLPPNDKVAHGKEAARKSVAELLGLPGLQLTWNANRVEVAASGDFAYITGVYTMSFNDDASKRISDAGKTPRGLESSARQKMEVRRRYLELRPAGIGTIGKPAGPGTISRHGNPNPWPAFG